MGWFTDDPDPWRLGVAIHELGHWFAWKDLPGTRIVRVRVTGTGRDAEGRVTVKWPTNDAGATDRGYLVGLLAGAEADRLHHERTGHPLRRDGWAHDLKAFTDCRRAHAPSRRWSESELRRDAHRLVLARWHEIQKLAPRLARTGRL